MSNSLIQTFEFENDKTGEKQTKITTPLAIRKDAKIKSLKQIDVDTKAIERYHDAIKSMGAPQAFADIERTMYGASSAAKDWARSADNASRNRLCKR